jgi:hypothetical protein
MATTNLAAVPWAPDDGPLAPGRTPAAPQPARPHDLYVVAGTGRSDAGRGRGAATSSPPAGTWASPVPCVAHPCAGLVHVDGPCQCFVGGPAPVHVQSAPRVTVGEAGERPGEVSRTA